MTRIPTFLISGACVIMALSSCHRSDSENADANSEINSFKITQNIKTSSCTYLMTGLGDSAHITLSTLVNWPEKLSDYDIHTLQDSILSMAFPHYNGNDVDSAIKEYIGHPGNMFENDSTLTFTPVESTTETMASYTADITVNTTDITQEYVTYRYDFSSYMGGAHPIWGSDFLTYIYKSSKIVSLEWLLKPGSESAVLPIVTEAIASEVQLSPYDLKQQMIADSLYVSDIVYIYNGLITFHYNPYALLPYPYGAIDAKVAPYEISEYMTPEAKELLLAEE